MRILKLPLILTIVSTTALACGGAVTPGGDGDDTPAVSQPHQPTATTDDPAHASPGQSPPSQPVVSPPSSADTESNVNPPAAQVWSIPDCAEPSGPIHTYTSVADVQGRISGVWYKCSGNVPGPADAVAIELAGPYAYLLVSSGDTLVRKDSWDYERNVGYIDTTMMNGPGYYQINLTSGLGTQMLQSRVSEDGRFLELVQSFDMSRYVRATTVVP
ncbi:hypothetical protein AKJ09_00757 [Labilithrix luteola]|uniref:Lipoprotein n=1 Tax=Labilithrix luteola TaxID=1391654 RepID=A0A0K1PKM9_9BACT|nr:hypothetical protein [Labilithrix luteola]AKU94093.1 hypothetical protein AKJ09_00757 [Labilithrix luteola]